MNWSIKTTDAFQFDIYIAGSYADILRSCKQFCTNVGYCVSVFPCEFPFKYGCESGAKITLINYARFPLSKDQLSLKAKEIAAFIAEECSQGTYSICGPDTSDYYSRKET
jgi:hypothetical protein